jgi:bacillithiol biosynthesis deacetylase BshB1
VERANGNSAVDLVAFAPHPDDVEFFCGGTMLVAARSGLRTAIVDLTEGELSTNGSPPRRSAERDAASEILGLTCRVSLGLPDGSVGSDTGHRAALIDVLRELRPRVVLAPHASDRHPDHAAAGRLVHDACFFAGVAKHTPSRPAHRPERVYSYMLHHPFDVSAVMDVGPVWEQRLELIDVYESQGSGSDGSVPTAINDPVFRELLVARATFYGAMAGVAHGEPFGLSGPAVLRAFPEFAEAANQATRYRMYL